MFVNMEKDTQILFNRKECEVLPEDLTHNFEYFLNKRFPPSLRPTGRRKWRSIAMVS